MSRRLPAFLFGALVTVGCLSSPALADQAGDLVAKGKACLAKGDYPGAKEAYLGAVKADGKNLDARRGAAEALLGLGQTDDAVEQASQGLEIAKDADAGLWLILARAYLRKGDLAPADQLDERNASYADAKAKASMALKQDPSLSLARAVLAKACRLTDDLDRAEKVVREGLEKAPVDFDLLMEKGAINLKKKEYPSALESFTKACEADPNSSEAYLQKGLALSWLKQWQDCYVAYTRASILDTETTVPLQKLATFAKDQSTPYLRQILKEKPNHAWAHAYLAYYLARAKDEAGAISEAKAAIALQPDNGAIITWYGEQVLEPLGKKEEALGVYRKALDKNPNLKGPFARLTDIALNPRSTAKPADKREIIDYLVKLGTGDGLFWNNVGLYHRDTTKDFRKSLEAYIKAAKLLPNDQGVQNDTGLIYLYNGKQIGEDMKKALPYFERAVALVEEENQAPEMGYRDAYQNLSRYYREADPNPEKVIAYATKRNSREFLDTLPNNIAAPSREVEEDRAWAEDHLKK